MNKIKKNEQPKDMQTALDCAIKKHDKKRGGYEINGTIYFNYMSNEDWDEYLNNMDIRHKSQFGLGAGGELKEGQFPPKMASFGSSSRLIYKLSKNIPNFIFEEKLDTRVGGTAHLDGFLRRGNHYIYVEAKRREIYGSSHENEVIKIVYDDVYQRIKEFEPDFDYESKECNSKNSEDSMKYTFKLKGEPVKYFDLKQLICHFLGISYDIAKHPVSDAKITFLYLLYNPDDVEIEPKYREKVKNRYNEVESFITINIDLFKRIFEAVLHYQVITHKLELPIIDFEFLLVTQNNYEEVLGNLYTSNNS